VGGKELAPLYLYFQGERGSDTFAADPPGRLNFRRGCKGTKVKTSLTMSSRREPDRALRSEAIASDAFSPKYTNRPAITALVLTFFPLQTRRRSSTAGGSAAKVFEPRPQKTKSKTTRRGEFFAAHPAGSIFGHPKGGAVGVAFFWLLFLARQEK
jgi:hypothetical protein